MNHAEKHPDRPEEKAAREKVFAPLKGFKRRPSVDANRVCGEGCASCEPRAREITMSHVIITLADLEEEELEIYRALSAACESSPELRVAARLELRQRLWNCRGCDCEVDQVSVRVVVQRDGFIWTREYQL